MTQSEQLAQAALQAPINNLVILVALFALIILLSVIYVAWKFAPVIFKQVQQQIETNAKLTEIVGQNSEQAKLNQETLAKNNDELVKQTASIDKLVTTTSLQGIDFKAYQTLVSGNMSNHTQEIVQLRASIDALPEQVKQIVQDTIICSTVETIITSFRDEIITIIQNAQIKTATSTHPTANNSEVTS